jgi:NADH-quinone oxidoreductase subunit L
VKAKEGTAGYHPHESPWTILIPLGLLSLGASSPARCSTVPSSSRRRAEFWRGSVAFRRASRPCRCTRCRLGEMYAAGGDADRPRIAYRNYIAKPDAPAAFVAMFPGCTSS